MTHTTNRCCEKCIATAMGGFAVVCIDTDCPCHLSLKSIREQFEQSVLDTLRFTGLPDDIIQKAMNDIKHDTNVFIEALAVEVESGKRFFPIADNFQDRALDEEQNTVKNEDATTIRNHKSTGV